MDKYSFLATIALYVKFRKVKFKKLFLGEAECTRDSLIDTALSEESRYSWKIFFSKKINYLFCRKIYKQIFTLW